MPRDSEQLEDTYTLNLTGTWTFPIKGRFAGRVGLEAVNVTNEQEVIGINRANSQPLPGIGAFQTPREYRRQIGIEFYLVDASRRRRGAGSRSGSDRLARSPRLVRQVLLARG